MALIDGLISYWKLDESSGDAVDAHGSNNLTDVASVGSASGKINGARDFESGSVQYFTRDSNSDLNTGDIDFTFSVWINAESFDAKNVILAKEVDTPGGARDYGLLCQADDLSFFIDGANKIVTISFTATSSWHFVVCWHDSVGDTINIQLDDGAPVSVATSGFVPTTSVATFRIGAREYSGFINPWDGLIDEVGFWKRVLTSQERTDLYNSGAGLPYSSFGGAPAAVKVGSMLAMFQ